MQQLFEHVHALIKRKYVFFSFHCANRDSIKSFGVVVLSSIVNVTANPTAAQIAGMRPKPFLETEKHGVMELHPCRFGEVSAQNK